MTNIIPRFSHYPTGTKLSRRVREIQFANEACLSVSVCVLMCEILTAHDTLSLILYIKLIQQQDNKILKTPKNNKPILHSKIFRLKQSSLTWIFSFLSLTSYIHSTVSTLTSLWYNTCIIFIVLFPLLWRVSWSELLILRCWHPSQNRRKRGV